MYEIYTIRIRLLIQNKDVYHHPTATVILHVAYTHKIQQVKITVFYRWVMAVTEWWVYYVFYYVYIKYWLKYNSLLCKTEQKQQAQPHLSYYKKDKTRNAFLFLFH